jgi:hypothetical protein
VGACVGGEPDMFEMRAEIGLGLGFHGRISELEYLECAAMSTSTQDPPSGDGERPAPPDDDSEGQPAHSWQAIYSPEHNAYYFYNTDTQETTWNNPIHPEPSPAASSASTDEDKDQVPTSSSTYTALQQAAVAQGIDPSLAYLDPTLLSNAAPGAAVPGANPSFTAKFNARTGAFARADARDPSHLSEYERAKRMSEFYFDVNAWETQREDEMGKEDGKKRKRPSKKDLVSLIYASY